MPYTFEIVEQGNRYEVSVNGWDVTSTQSMYLQAKQQQVQQIAHGIIRTLVENDRFADNETLKLTAGPSGPINNLRIPRKNFPALYQNIREFIPPRLDLTYGVSFKDPVKTQVEELVIGQLLELLRSIVPVTFTPSSRD